MICFRKIPSGDVACFVRKKLGEWLKQIYQAAKISICRCFSCLRWNCGSSSLWIKALESGVALPLATALQKLRGDVGSDQLFQWCVFKSLRDRHGFVCAVAGIGV